jgi:hypothetical protein
VPVFRLGFHRLRSFLHVIPSEEPALFAGSKSRDHGNASDTRTLPVRALTVALTSSGKIFTQVAELRIHSSNQCKFLFPPPSLDLFFAADRIPDITKRLEIDQTDHFVSFCEAWADLFFVLGHAAFKVVGDARIKHPGRTGQNINMVNSHGRGFWHG